MPYWTDVHIRRLQIRFGSLKHSNLTSNSYTFCCIIASAYHLQEMKAFPSFMVYSFSANPKFSWQRLYLKYSCIHREVTTGSPVDFMIIIWKAFGVQAAIFQANYFKCMQGIRKTEYAKVRCIGYKSGIWLSKWMTFEHVPYVMNALWNLASLLRSTGKWFP